jgi:hypothetical protein
VVLVVVVKKGCPATDGAARVVLRDVMVIADRELSATLLALIFLVAIRLLSEPIEVPGKAPGTYKVWYNSHEI